MENQYNSIFYLNEFKAKKRICNMIYDIHLKKIHKQFVFHILKYTDDKFKSIFM